MQYRSVMPSLGQHKLSVFNFPFPFSFSSICHKNIMHQIRCHKDAADKIIKWDFISYLHLTIIKSITVKAIVFLFLKKFGFNLHVWLV